MLNSVLNVVMGSFQAVLLLEVNGIISEDLRPGCFYPCGNPVCFLSAHPQVKLALFRLAGITGVVGAEWLVGGSS